MWRIIACLSLAIGAMACQPLYGGKAQGLAKLPERAASAEAPKDPDAPPKMAEDCSANFHGDPSNVRVQTAASRALTTAGESALVYADKTADPTNKGAGIKAGIDQLRDALIKDPYNAEATLLLALAYDEVHKKGCALALLKRLASLTTNSKYTKEANLRMTAVDNNSRWFRYYRKDAIAAIGH